MLTRSGRVRVWSEHPQEIGLLLRRQVVHRQRCHDLVEWRGVVASAQSGPPASP
jgi:hypothetical protein